MYAAMAVSTATRTQGDALCKPGSAEKKEGTASIVSMTAEHGTLHLPVKCPASNVAL